jgi:hypothetical protein
VIIVLAECLQRDFLPEGEVSDGVLGACAVRLAFLGSIDAVEKNLFGSAIVQDFDGVAIEDGDNGAGEVQREYG